MNKQPSDDEGWVQAAELFPWQSQPPITGSVPVWPYSQVCPLSVSENLLNKSQSENIC